MRYDIILWDLDNTILDFDKAESKTMKSLFLRFGFGECTDEMVARYSEINKEYWHKLERGEMAKSDILVKRFESFFEECGIDVALAGEFNSLYQLSLGDTIAFRDNAFEIVQSLRGVAKQYIVSNGTIQAQRKKLKLSGLDKIVDGVFLSEELGAEKPSIDFFDRAFAKIGDFDKDRAIIIGDSLTSDIKGGNNAGIAACWYNFNREPLNHKAKPDFEIDELHKIFAIIDK